jgi:hypothetical protein
MFWGDISILGVPQNDINFHHQKFWLRDFVSSVLVNVNKDKANIFPIFDLQNKS